MTKLPIISLNDFEAKYEKRVMVKSLVENVTIGLKSNLESVNIAEIKNHNVMISVPKAEWKSGLEKAIDYYVETEEYEECSKIKNLIDKL